MVTNPSTNRARRIAWLRWCAERRYMYAKPATPQAVQFTPQFSAVLQTQKIADIPRRAWPYIGRTWKVNLPQLSAQQPQPSADKTIHLTCHLIWLFRTLLVWLCLLSDFVTFCIYGNIYFMQPAKSRPRNDIIMCRVLLKAYWKSLNSLALINGIDHFFPMHSSTAEDLYPDDWESISVTQFKTDFV